MRLGGGGEREGMSKKLSWLGSEEGRNGGREGGRNVVREKKEWREIEGEGVTE